MIQKSKRFIKHYIHLLAVNFVKLVDQQTSASFSDIQALHQFQRLNSDYMPWTQSAMRPSALLLVLNEVEIHRRIRVLEFGSGVSTVYLAKRLKQLGGTLLSIDDNKDWQSLVVDHCSDCIDNSTFVFAPTRNIKVGKFEYLWYDTEILLKYLKNFKADLIIIDGPVAKSCRMARYPALPFLRNFLAEDFTIFLDDINRRDELITAMSWANEYNLSLDVIYSKGNVGVLRPMSTTSKYNIY
jgi:hypothetical protein